MVVGGGIASYACGGAAALYGFSTVSAKRWHCERLRSGALRGTAVLRV